MTKPLHAGLGARNGVLAAKLAAGGYTANGKAIESGFGFYKVLHQGTPIDEKPIEESANRMPCSATASVSSLILAVDLPTR